MLDIETVFGTEPEPTTIVATTMEPAPGPPTSNSEAGPGGPDEPIGRAGCEGTDTPDACRLCAMRAGCHPDDWLGGHMCEDCTTDLQAPLHPLDNWLVHEDFGAWTRSGGRYTGPDATDNDWGSLPDPGPPCPTCGGFHIMWDILGERHCQRCEADKLARSRRLADRAERLRLKAPPKKRASPVDNIENTETPRGRKNK